MTDKTGQKPDRGWFTEGLIIATIPIAVYSLAFAYEAGFARSFKVPIDFISLDINNIFIFSASLVLVFYTINIALFYLNPLFMIFYPILSPPMKRSILKILSMIIFCIPILYILDLEAMSVPSPISPIPYIIWPVIGSGILLIFLEFIYPLLTQRSKETYEEKLIAQEDLEREVKTTYNILFEKIGYELAIIIFLIIFLAFSSYALGRYEAVNKKEYLVLNNTNKVVLRIYGNQMVVAPIDKMTKKVSPKFSLMKLSDDPNLILVLENIGPLMLEQ